MAINPDHAVDLGARKHAKMEREYKKLSNDLSKLERERQTITRALMSGHESISAGEEQKLRARGDKIERATSMILKRMVALDQKMLHG